MSVRLEIGSLKETYDNIDLAMKDCLELYPEADFSWWNDAETTTWIDIYKDINDKTIVGKIFET